MHFRAQGPERFAEPFANFGDDVEEHCNLAAKLASTGRAVQAARESLGASGSLKPAHIILPKRSDSNVNISDFGVSSDQKEGGRRFCAWALFLNPSDDGDDAEGVMVHFFMSKYDKRNYQHVSEDWAVEKDLVFRVDSHRISNKNIKAAIERDAATFKLGTAAAAAAVGDDAAAADAEDDEAGMGDDAADEDAGEMDFDEQY